MNKISGIYKIQSISHPERCYIGSAVDISDRWRCHLKDLKKGKRTNKKLQNHYNKYGFADFSFSILLYGCKKEELITIEQYFLDSYKPYFNICKIAGSQLGRHWKLSNKVKQNMRKPHCPMSEETKQKLRNIIPWNKGKKMFFSKEARKNNSEAIKKPIFQYDKNMNFIKEWNSATDASKELLIVRQSISDCLRGERSTAGGFIWKYKKDILKVA